MKIRQIRFKNINSFYGEHDPISFSDGILAQTGLFVIAGPTGAGKSTLLDVITLALFNRVPRVTEGDGRGLSRDKMLAEGLIINQKSASEPKTEVYAEVEYELNGQAYRSRWSIEKNRNSNWNDYDMELALLPDGQILSNKKGDVPGLNVKHIGLTYEQFIRSMVLAQGAFDKFLKASSAERSKLLEQITGTEIYRQLSRRAHTEYKLREDALKLKRQEVGMVQMLSDDQVADLIQRKVDVGVRLTELDNALTTLRAERELLKTIAGADSTLADLDQQTHALTKRQAQFAPGAEQLIRHQQVADLAGALADLASTVRNRDDATADKMLATNNLRAQQEDLDKLLIRAHILTQQPALTSDDLVEHVNLFRDQVTALTDQMKRERDAAKQPCQTIQSLITDAKDAWIAALDWRDLPQLTVSVTEQRTAVAPRLAGLADSHPKVAPETVNADVLDLIRQQQAITDLVRLQREQQQRLTDGVNLNKKVAEQQKITTDLTTIVERLNGEFADLERVKSDIEQRKSRLDREASVEKLRETLLDNEPCPLCGSLHHPYAHLYVQQAGNIALALRLATDDLEIKRQERDAVYGKLIQAQTAEDGFRTQVTEMRILYKEWSLEIKNKLTESHFDESYTPNVLTDVLQSVVVQTEELTQLQQLWTQDQLLSQIVTELDLFRASNTRFNQLKAAKDKLFPGDDIKSKCDDLLRHFNEINQQVATQRGLWQKADDAHKKFDDQYTDQIATLQPLLQQRGFSDVSAARACLLDARTLRQLTDEQQTLSELNQTLAVKIQQATRIRQKALDARQTTQPVDEVTEQLLLLDKEQRQKREQLGDVKAQLLADTNQRKQHGKLLKRLDELEQQAVPWRELDQLIGSAKGDEFSRFAQGLTLTQLIALANRRLRDLSDRYLLLKPRDGQDELFVLDQYQGGAERTVTSLSGGETFTLSLALALALSDLASQNVQIDSLFVDEGFGTLDPETLDTAIVMLEKLQQESQKTIGIISHRHEIKERISVQVQVEKGSDGNSRVSIVEL
ncbi:MAG: AAA family ATPase [Bacteroidetes bacterium]|nr:AAA family ATPase [Fibrella sp.]